MNFLLASCQRRETLDRLLPRNSICVTGGIQFDLFDAPWADARNNGLYNLRLQLLRIFRGLAAGQFHFAACAVRDFLTHSPTWDIFPLAFDEHTPSRGACTIVIAW